MKIRRATRDDWAEIRRIYLQGIGTGNATFERAEDVPDGSTWFAKKLPNLVFKAVDEAGCMLGWCAVSGVSSRCVYSGVAEVSVYVAQAARGQGVGTALLKQLIDASESAGIWTLEAGIFPENEASIKLHQKLGFRIVGVRERLGRLNGVWRDVVLLERRSERF